MTTQTLETVLLTLRHYKLLSTNQILIVGVSGGTDSLALLHILNVLRHQLGFHLHIATLNHGIRGERAEQDARFVEQIAVTWGIAYTRGDVDVPQLAKSEKIGIEAAARKARYDFLAQVAYDQQTNLVAVAHHANDQAETILMHIVRGSGLNGLRGMSPVSQMPNYPDLTLIRPLLHVSRAELEQYCIDRDLQPRHDETNDDTNYHRNYIRQEVMPRLEVLNPNVVSALIRLSDSATLDAEYLSAQLEREVLRYVVQSEGRWQIELSRLNDAPLALQRRYILYAFRVLSRATEQLGAEQVALVLAWIAKAQVASTLDLGQRIRCRMGYDHVFIERSDIELIQDTTGLIPPNTMVMISQHSAHHSRYIDDLVHRYGLQVRVSDVMNPTGTEKCICVPHDIDVMLRTRRAGDRFSPRGMAGRSRKLKDWMIDRKIPRHLRDSIPLIEAGGRIMAIYSLQTWHLAEALHDERDCVYVILGGYRPPN